MDKLKEIAKDPAKLEEEINKAWEKMDVDKKGYITGEQLKAAMIAQAKALGLPTDKEPTAEQKEQAKKILDPAGNNQITLENYKKFVLAGVAKAKAEGKL